MENYRIILIPVEESELFYEFTAPCASPLAAGEYAKVQLTMASGRYKEARVMSQWKSELAWRQAIPPIFYNNNL